MRLPILLLCVLVALLLFFAASSLLPMRNGVNSRVTKAFAIWKANPSPETEAEWLQERSSYRSYQSTQFALETGRIWLPLLANTVAIVIVVRRSRLKAKIGNDLPKGPSVIESKT
jgi:hypothetical protein